jgi:hypothetical protein
MGLATSICVGLALRRPGVLGAGAVEAASVVPEPVVLLAEPGLWILTTTIDLIFIFSALLPPYKSEKIGAYGIQTISAYFYSTQIK